jgi:hypothetical protein
VFLIGGPIPEILATNLAVNFLSCLAVTGGFAHQLQRAENAGDEQDGGANR